jgi:hypothetical protein
MTLGDFARVDTFEVRIDGGALRVAQRARTEQGR